MILHFSDNLIIQRKTKWLSQTIPTQIEQQHEFFRVKFYSIFSTFTFFHFFFILHFNWGFFMSYCVKKAFT